MAAYGLRGAALLSHVRRAAGRAHAESFLGAHMAARGVANIDSDVVFQRVRADGHVEHRDAALAAAAAAKAAKKAAGGGDKGADPAGRVRRRRRRWWWPGGRGQD